VPQSLLRNLFFAIAGAIAFSCLLYYWALPGRLDTYGGLAYFALGAVEGLVLLWRKDGRRLGDLIARTKVVEIAMEPSSRALIFKKVMGYSLIVLAIVFLSLLLVLSILYALRR
jgi:uncharacterized RDD family membrane protein YckC